MRKVTRITTITSEEALLIASLTQLTYDAFKQPFPNWLPTLADARRQVLNALAADRICRVLMDANDNPLGWIAAIPLNHGRIWEIHPLVVAVAEQGKGYGRAKAKVMSQRPLSSSRCAPIFMPTAPSIPYCARLWRHNRSTSVK